MTLTLDRCVVDVEFVRAVAGSCALLVLTVAVSLFVLLGPDGLAGLVRTWREGRAA